MGPKLQVLKEDDYRLRKILVTIESSQTHCSGDCVALSNDGEVCRIFERKLEWDRAKSTNGQFRLAECKEAEQQALAKNATPERGDGCTRVKCENAPVYILRWQSKGAQGPVYAKCCKTHMIEAVEDYHEDATGDGLKVSRL